MKYDFLIVGNYSHDILNVDGKRIESLGGPPAYISKLLHAFGKNFRVISKVGKDFKYTNNVIQEPIITDKPTTCIEHSYSEGKRTSILHESCQNIMPKDIDCEARVCIIGAHVNEIPPETVLKIHEIADSVFVDIQGLIRVFNDNGHVSHSKLDDTPYWNIIDKIDYLKIGNDEIDFVDMEKTRQRTKLLITLGKGGCQILTKKNDVMIPPFPTEEIDPTGAGDSFTTGFAMGLSYDLSIEDCVKLANYCGAIAVSQIGPPEITDEMKDTINKMLEEYRITGEFPLEKIRRYISERSSTFNKLIKKSEDGKKSMSDIVDKLKDKSTK